MNLGRIAIVAQGDYDATRKYKKLDTVNFKDSIYIALMALDEGESPTIAPTKWMLGAGKGKDFEALYNDFPETLAGDVLKRVDKSTGVDVNYREVDFWHDGTYMTDSRVDGVLYIKKGNKYYVDVQMFATKEINVLKFNPEEVDATEAINKAIDVAPPGFTVNCQNRNFNVSSIWLKSDITFRNANLKSIGTDQNDISVVCIGNDLNPSNYAITHPMGNKYAQRSFDIAHSNIIIDNVFIDGNRANQTNITDRDGGRQGFCLKGRVSNVKIKNCEANYCATDGIQIYRGLAYLVASDADFAANEIIIDNCSFLWNRRHGGSADSINGLVFKNTNYKYNGRTIGSSEGEQGDEFAGELYGVGFDIEGYGLGSGIKNIDFINCDLTQNQKGSILMFDDLGGDETDFTIRDLIIFKGCKMDSGIMASNLYAFTASPPQAKIVKGTYLYGTIILDNCVVDGMYFSKSVKNFIALGGVQTFSKTTEFYALFQNTKASILNQSDKFLLTGQDYKVKSNRTIEKIIDYGVTDIAPNATTLVSVDIIGASYGDKVDSTLSNQYSSAEKNLLITSFVAFPGNKVLVSFTNNSSGTITFDGIGKLKVVVTKDYVENIS